MKIHKHHIIHKHLWGIILCSLCFSCQQKAREMTDVRILHPREAIETDIDVLTDSIAYIPLETSDECLLDNILSAKRDGGCFFVQDGKGLYAFDGTGRFLNEIGRRGNGPEEYLYMDCYALDRTNKLVYVVSNVQKKIFRYTYQGKFHSALYVDPHDANIASLTVCNDSVLLAYYPLPNKAADSGCAYARLDIAGNRLASHKLIDAVTVHSGAAHYPLLYHPMAFFQGEWLMIVPLSNEVYAYDGREITGKYVIDVPDMAADKAFLAGSQRAGVFGSAQSAARKRVRLRHHSHCCYRWSSTLVAQQPTDAGMGREVLSAHRQHPYAGCRCANGAFIRWRLLGRLFGLFRSLFPLQQERAGQRKRQPDLPAPVQLPERGRQPRAFPVSL